MSPHRSNNDQRTSLDQDAGSGRPVWKWLLTGVAGLLVAVAAILVMSITLLNETWLQRQLVAQARKMFDIDLAIESLDFHPWQGQADLHGVTLDLEKPNQDIHGEIESIHVKMALWPLLFREVDVENLTVTEPRITYILDRPAEPQDRATFDQVAEKVVAVVDNLLMRIAETLLEAFRPKEGYDIRIGRLEVVDGIVDCTVTRPGVEPVHVLFDDVDYAASDVRPSQRNFGVWGYVSHADMSADLHVGDARVSLEQQFAASPRVLRIGNLDLGQVDRLGSQKDAIVFKQGTLDLLYQDRGNEFEVDAKLTGLQLEKNEEADLPDFLLMSVDRLIEYVAENDGSLVLQFTRERKHAQVSDDLEFMMVEAWNGMWAEILKRFQNEAVEELNDWKAQGTEKLRGFLRNKDLLKEKEGNP